MSDRTSRMLPFAPTGAQRSAFVLGLHGSFESRSNSLFRLTPIALVVVCQQTETKIRGLFLA